MDFYVTLPSSGSDLKTEYGKLNNTKTDFETHLKIPLDFDHKKYQVALSEFTYKKSWLINIGEFKLTKKLNPNATFEAMNITCNSIDGMDISKVIHNLNYQFQTLLKPRLPDNSRLFFTLNEWGVLQIDVPYGFLFEMKGYFVSLLMEGKDLTVYSKKLNESVDIVSYDHIKVDGDKVDSTMNALFFLVSNSLNYIEELYIYTNIIHDVHVGSETLKLLRIVTVGSSDNHMTSDIFNVPHYLPLDSSFIETIRMFIRDSKGNKIRFLNNFSQVTYKLHFKLK